LALAAVASLVLGGTALAAIDASQVITTRQEKLKTLGKTFKAFREEFAKPSLDRAALTSETQTMEQLAAALPSWFPAGSGPEAGVKTAAKAEIWSNAGHFTEVSQGLITQTHKLAQLAATGDADSLKAQAKEVGAACGACHKEFKVKDD
jgi:cytochrome c556